MTFDYWPADASLVDEDSDPIAIVEPTCVEAVFGVRHRLKHFNLTSHMADLSHGLIANAWQACRRAKRRGGKAMESWNPA